MTDPNEDIENAGSPVSVVLDARCDASFIVVVLDTCTMKDDCRRVGTVIVYPVFHA